ncbi:MAG: non-homologous end-joining DNA ligase, partial [Myxococcales bacterium]|nr:non-homologous end-joining DNA ligase [Myxococcales bacterium]
MATRHYGRHSVETANEDKVLFPDDGLAKGDLIDHYERVWTRMRAHLADRPLVMERFPDGIASEGFFQKQVPDHFPAWIDRVRVARRDASPQELVVCGTKGGLAYLANQACVTPHLWLCRASRLDAPDELVFDLDPPDRDFAPVRRAALWCRALLDELGLFAVAKTTGSRGVHVVVPLRAREGFDGVRDLAHRIANELARRHPDALTTEQRLAKRGGRLYLDVGRNAHAQTAVAPYAVRAREGAPVATPVAWEELARGDV